MMANQNRPLGTLKQRPGVIFVMGAGRSGSTVLDLFLGQHPMIQSAGELCNIVNSGWIGGEYCSCGERVPACAFWSDVRRVWEDLTGAQPQEYEKLRSLVEQRKSTLWKMLWTDRPENISLAEKGSGKFLAYVQWTHALYRAISKVSGKPIIIDSSKNAARGLALVMMDQRMDLIDLHLIHLIRDVRGFVWSQRKSFRRDERAGVARDLAPRPVWKSILVWLLVNTISERARARHEQSQALLLRYEDFASDTLQEAIKLAAFLGVSAEPWLEIVTTQRPLEPGHVVAGNRVRMQRRIVIRPDTEWQSRLTRFEKALCWFLAGWKARHYGYVWQPVTQPDERSGGHDLPKPHYLRGARSAGNMVANAGQHEA
ncbi:MAG: sulfotransferase family protein [Thermogutta sp.]